LAVASTGAARGKTVRVEFPEPTRVHVPAGRFTMGLPPGDVDVLLDECRLAVGAPNETRLDQCRSWGAALERRTHREVWVDGFWMDVTEVTGAAYRACARAGVCDVAPLVSGDVRHLGDALPVVNVTRAEAGVFCGWRGGRLPTEAEWERAARGDDNRTFAWGNGKPTPELACYGRKPGAKGATTSPVGSHPAGAGPYGHVDLTGNVWEWTADLYDPFAYRRPGAPDGVPGSCSEILETQSQLRRNKQQGFTGRNPIPSVCERVLRGGAFNYDAAGLRASNRVHHPENWRMLVAGFRCAKDE
jgi:formylglycine-generating enzyme required for sulfatase activity